MRIRDLDNCIAKSSYNGFKEKKEIVEKSILNLDTS